MCGEESYRGMKLESSEQATEQSYGEQSQKVTNKPEQTREKLWRNKKIWRSKVKKKEKLEKNITEKQSYKVVKKKLEKKIMEKLEKILA